MNDDRKDLRAVYTLLIVIVIIIIMALYGWLSGAWEASAQQPDQIYRGIPLDAHLLELDKQALELAYQAHLQLLWSNWLKDQAGDASRISRGLQIARRAYGQAAIQITKREQELQRR